MMHFLMQEKIICIGNEVSNLALRPIFIATPNKKNFVDTVYLEFKWYPGFSIKQKQQSIKSLHDTYFAKFNRSDILEISSKSPNELGVLLSAFNLMIETKSKKTFSVESAFQSSKVFERGGPFIDLIGKSSREAKKDPRLNSSGKLICFEYFNRKWPLEPKTLFYDWLYINTLSLHKELCNRLLEFNAFSDIEFNHEKSINCQARSAALFVALHYSNLLDYVLSSPEKYTEIMTGRNNDNQQICLFDE